jgi:hypothetical protein
MRHELDYLRMQQRHAQDALRDSCRRLPRLVGNAVHPARRPGRFAAVLAASVAGGALLGAHLGSMRKSASIGAAIGMVARSLWSVAFSAFVTRVLFGTPEAETPELTTLHERQALLESEPL